jgi:gamma-glutamyl-gamma-aminobutyrate hydrolase PuuD
LGNGSPPTDGNPSVPFVLGVQWHPEADPASRVIEAFVAEAARASIAVPGS